MADRHLPLGPLLWGRADSAKALEDGARTAWDEGVASAAEAFDQPRSGLGVLQAVAAAIAAVFAGKLAGDHFPIQVVVRACLALGAYWFVPTAWAVVVATMAPARQRDEAREQWKLEEERAQSLQEDIERLALVRPEIEECQVSISGLQQSIQHNRDAGIDWLIERVGQNRRVTQLGPRGA